MCIYLFIGRRETLESLQSVEMFRAYLPECHDLKVHVNDKVSIESYHSHIDKEMVMSLSVPGCLEVLRQNRFIGHGSC